MIGVGQIVKEPLEIRVKADCGSCKTKGAYFDYLGLNITVLDSGMTKFLLEKYGNDVLFLYGCGTCKTSMTLTTLKSSKDNETYFS